MRWVLLGGDVMNISYHVGAWEAKLVHKRLSFRDYLSSIVAIFLACRMDLGLSGLLYQPVPNSLYGRLRPIRHV